MAWLLNIEFPETLWGEQGALHQFLLSVPILDEFSVSMTSKVFSLLSLTLISLLNPDSLVVIGH